MTPINNVFDVTLTNLLSAEYTMNHQPKQGCSKMHNTLCGSNVVVTRPIVCEIADMDALPF